MSLSTSLWVILGRSGPRLGRLRELGPNVVFLLGGCEEWGSSHAEDYPRAGSVLVQKRPTPPKSRSYTPDAQAQSQRRPQPLSRIPLIVRSRILVALEKI